MSNNDDLLAKDVDKVGEYFKIKGIMKTLRNDLKDFKVQHQATQELEKLNKKVKELREDIKGDETIRELTEKIGTMKERLELLKELIRIDLLENAMEEVKKDGRKLKLVHVLKEMKDEERAKGSRK